MTAMVLDQPAELTWGGCVLHSEAPVDTPYRFEALVGTHFGNPVPMFEVVRSYLGDGDLVKRTGWGNRDDVPVFIRVSAVDGQGLALGEAALAAEFMIDEDEQFAPLVWRSPALAAWPLAFDVVHVTPQREWPVEKGTSWDYRERYACQKVYQLGFTTLPFVRDLEPVLIPALPIPEDPDEEPVYELIDDCSSTVGWSDVRCHAAEWSAPTLTSGTTSGNTWIRATSTLRGTTWNADHTPSMGPVRGGATDLAGLPYLTIDCSQQVFGVVPRVVVVAGGVTYQPVAASKAGGGLWWRLYFQIPTTGPINNLQIRGLWDNNPLSQSHAVTVYEIGRADRLAVDGSNGLQVTRTALIEGTAPTGAAVEIETADAGNVFNQTMMIVTGRSPVVPLRAHWVSSAAVVPDDTMMSGARNTLATPMVLRVPIAELDDSKYRLLTKLTFTGTATIDWQAKTVAADGSTIPGSDLVISGTQLLRAPTSAWRIHALAAPLLPIIGTESNTTDCIELTLSMASGGAGVTIDEGWLTNGAVTLLHKTDSYAVAKVELRSPQLDAPYPSVHATWTEGGVERVQDITRLAQIGTHDFPPGPIYVCTAGDSTRYANAALRYFRKYFLTPGPTPPAVPDEG